eukprot:scaffold104503_cov15-Tisochrysis_lutea.AAC.1
MASFQPFLFDPLFWKKEKLCRQRKLAYILRKVIASGVNFASINFGMSRKTSTKVKRSVVV